MSDPEIDLRAIESRLRTLVELQAMVAGCLLALVRPLVPEAHEHAVMLSNYQKIVEGHDKRERDIG